MLKALEKYVVDNSPAILTGVAAVGVLSTAFLTGRASFQAAEIRRDKAEEQLLLTEQISWKWVAKNTWKLYIPAGISGAMTVTCIIAANRIGARRAAALATTITILERGFEEYRDKVKEHLGAKREEEVRAEVVQDQINRETRNHEIVLVGEGKVLCRDAFSGRYFESDVETIRKAENDVNRQINLDSYASLTDFYDLIGLETTSISNEVGWTLDRPLEIRYTSALAEGKKPVLSIEFKIEPVRNHQWLG